MKRAYTLSGVVAVVVIGFIGVPLFLRAAEFQAGNQVSLPAGATTTDDLYAAGGSVVVSSNVLGDVYAAGGSVLMNGSVSHDVVLAGGTLTVVGSVGDDARLAGGNITLQGTVEDDVIVAGGQVVLSGSKIGGDVSVGGGMVRIEAPVGGKVKIGGGEVYLNGPIAGSVEVESDKLTLGSKAVIEGDVIYRGPQEAIQEQGAVVRGEIRYEPREEHEKKGTAAGIFSLFTLGGFLALLAGSLVLGLFFRRHSVEMVKHAYEKPLLEFGRGFAVLILMPVAAIILCITLLGIPLGIMLFLGYFALLIVVWLMVPIILGGIIYRWIGKNKTLEVSWLTILLGTVVYSLLSFIPIIGWLVQLVIYFITLGTLAYMKWNNAKAWR